MHDPWDVASTRRSDQYVSCMKINGVPLLPPVLSKDCRNEMQYYKVLAMEVEKRISLLNTFAGSAGSNDTINKCSPHFMDPDPTQKDSIANDKEKNIPLNDQDDKEQKHEEDLIVANGYDSIKSDITVIDNSDHSPTLSSPKLVIGANISIGDIFEDAKSNDIINETPERDYNCLLNKPVVPSDYPEKPNDFEIKKDECPREHVMSLNDKENNFRFSHSPDKESISKTIGPPSLSSSKSFNDIPAELSSPPELVRQSSYTILKPSAALLAHLEVQSLSSGVEMSSISMSESCSNLSWSKKRRSWDLETAKVKWSSMATELNKGVKKGAAQKRTHLARSNVRPASQSSPSRARSMATERLRRSTVPTSRAVNPYSVNNKCVSKSSVAPSARTLSPARKSNMEPKLENVNKNNETPQIATPVAMKKIANDIKESPNVEFTAKLSMITTEAYSAQPPSPPKSSGSDTPVREDPSTCIKELYDKIQNQQFVRMASLIEKQKKEQLLLQQVFEEQNCLFYKQLKTICPKSPNEIKEAWSEKPTSNDPVSLSQVIHAPNKTSDTNCTVDLSTTINDSQNYIHKTEEVLKKSRNVLSSIKNSAKKNKNRSAQDSAPNGNSSSPITRPKSVPSGIPRRDEKALHSSTRTLLNSPRKHLNSNSSQGSREAEPILTDRTNDTMADLNFTLTSDDNTDFGVGPQCSDSNTTFVKEEEKLIYDAAISPYYPQRAKTVTRDRERGKLCRSGSVDSNMFIESNEMVRENPKTSLHSERRTVRKLFAERQPTVQERAAASRIVAHARGYLVRRLMRTERVRATVQTIRDALVCALDLHRDRDGIRGADVDLHRRLIQQITAACYSLNETFVTSSAQDRCALIAQDRERQRALTEKQMSGSSSYPTPRSLAAAPAPHRRLSKRKSDIMSHSHSGVVGGPARCARASMTHSSHEMYSGDDKWCRQTSKKYIAAAKELHSRRPWR